MTTSLRLCSLAALLLSLAAPTRADNSPESELATFKQYVLPKISYACGTDFSIEYDGKSLRQHDEYIAHDQKSGDQECNEPFRYLWFVCQTEPGKAAVKQAGIKGVLCKGTPASKGSLTLSGGKLVVERAAKEDKPYVQQRKRFEELLKTRVVFGKNSGPDPYADQTFSDLMGQPNPTLSQTDYCVVNGQRLELQPFSRLSPRGHDAQINCWEHGKPIIDLTVSHGKKTGLLTEEHGRDGRRVSHYRDGKLHGDVRVTEGDQLVSLAHYDDDRRVWWQDNAQGGRLSTYTHQYPEGQAHVAMTRDGKVYSLRCYPSARDDKQFKEVCGFGAARTTRIYDGTNKVNRVETWRDGVLVERKSGDSTYAERSEVSYQNGKKHGRERVLRADGSLESETDWYQGIKHGREVTYDETGKKVVKEVAWRGGKPLRVTAYYLNGSRELQQDYDGERAMHEQSFWDRGQLRTDTQYAACPERELCKEGVERSFYEDGKKQEEAQYHLDVLHGPRNAYYPTGKPSAVEQYADGKLVKAKRWSEDGKVTEDAEYEADGSRKLRR